MGKDRYTLIEQSNILLKQLVSHVVPCQFTESGHATDVHVCVYVYIHILLFFL